MGINTNANPLARKSNYDILNAIRYDAGLDYQNRIPVATKGNMQRTMQRLLDNRPLMNQFVDALVNRIGLTLLRTDRMWNNPLAQFKMPDFTYGDTIEEYMVGLVKAYAYDPDRESTEKDIWSKEAPHVEARFHQVNRREKYKITVNEEMLRGAFLSGDHLGDFVADILNAPVKADQWDEFLAMLSLIPDYESNGGYYHMRIPELSSLDSTGDEARHTLRRMRAVAGNLPFLSTKYNAAHMPVHADPEDMILIATPEFQAAIDVEALAAAFNRDNMVHPFQVITVPKEHVGIDYFEALLTTKDHFVVADVLQTTASIHNPDTLDWNYWHHHHQILSVSQFTPAIMFNTRFDDEVIEVQKPVEGISAITMLAPDDESPVPTNVNRGDYLALDVEVTSEALREGVLWAVKGAESGETYITSTGVLHVSPYEPADEVTVVAMTTWIDPSDPTAERHVAELVVPIVGEVEPEWPSDHAGQHVDGNDEPTEPTVP